MEAGQLTPIVRGVVGDQSAVVRDRWSADPMEASSIGSGTVGFVKVAGLAQVRGEDKSWSIVIKALDTKVSGDFTSPQREVDAFRSGFFESLNGGLRAVPCHGITSTSEGLTLLWLSDLSGSTKPPWTKEEFITAARHVGHFNGSWPAGAAPAGTWLDRQYKTNRPSAAAAWRLGEKLAGVREHPVIHALSAGVGREKLLSLPEEFNEIAEAASRLPRVITHNDCHPRNLFLDTDRSGAPVTYAIDWSSVGLGPVGLDGGNVAGGGMNWRGDEARLVRSSEPSIFEAYLEGLRSSGYAFDLPEVRLGYLSNFVAYLLAYVVAGMQTARGGSSASHYAARFQLEGDAFVEELAVRLELYLPLFDEALGLARHR